MKRDRILNPDLISSIAAIGHTEYLVIADAGLPVYGFADVTGTCAWFLCG